MLKEITTPHLRITYEEDGPESGEAIVLLHGFPDDANTWKQVSASLVEKGYRTIAPYQRGYGKTMLAGNQERSGQYTALVSDVLALYEALRLPPCVVVGHDWGSTTAFELAALQPAR